MRTVADAGTSRKSRAGARGPRAAPDDAGGAVSSHRASSSRGRSRQSAVATAISFGVTSSRVDVSTSPVVRSIACTPFVAGSVT